VSKPGVVTEQVGWQHDMDVPVVIVAKNHPVTAQQSKHPMVMRVDPLGTALHVLAVDERSTNGAGATSEARPCFDQRDVVTAFDEPARRREAGHTGTDDDHTHARRALTRRRASTRSATTSRPTAARRSTRTTTT